MGLSVELFIEPVDDSLKCALCSAVYEEPVVTSCGHVYCAACLRDWLGKSGTCPRSCKEISFEKEDVTRLLPLQSLVNRLRIRCVHHVRGCDSVQAVDGMLAHLEVCEYARETPREKATATTTTTTTMASGGTIISCSDQRVVGCGEKPPEVSEFSQVLVCKKGCGLPLLFQGSSDHDCVKSLQAQVGSLQTKLTRTEHDKEKVSQRLVKREECMQERFTQLEKELRQYQEQTLKYERVASDHRSQIKYLQRQLDHRCDQASEESEVKVVLERHDGVLGFNIRGGTEDDDAHCGLYVSKIVENSPASQPGKLQLYDRILQIDNVNLTNASHEEAVHAFKVAGDTLDITVKRLFNPRAGNDMLTSSAVQVSVGVQTDATEASDTSRTPMTCCRCSSSNRSSQEFSSQGGINFLHQREDSGVDETGEHPSDVELHNGCDANEPLDKRKSTEEYASSFASDNGVILDKLLLNTSLAALDKRGSRASARRDHRSQATYEGEDNSELHSLSNGYYSGNVSQASLENVKHGVAENENVEATRTLDGNEGSVADDLQDCNGFNDDQLYFDPELEYEYEEITIKMGGQQSLGLTLNSGDGDDVNSIFVKEVDPRLLVGKDGRVMEGDQILKINDMAITYLADAVDLLGKIQSGEIRFLVARPFAELQATLLGAESDHGESPSEQTQRFHLEAYPIGVIQEEDEDEVETIMGDKCEKDSGFGRTDESLKNDESSEQDAGDDHHRHHKGSPKEQHKAQMDALGKQIIHFTACASNAREQPSRDSPRERSSDEHSQRSSERERREAKGSKHRSSATKTSADENTHSSGHERRSANKSHKSPKSPKNPDAGPGASSRHKERSESKEKEKGEHRRTKKDRAKDTADSSRSANGSRAPKEEHAAPAHKPNGDQQSCNNENGEMKVEWRVRRNKDGSRIFISKKLRPAKQKLLRERAQKLAEERRGLTTDDETQSVYLGRYWSRDDRRRQLDKVREARRLKKIELETEAANGGAQKRNDLAIIELTQKKMACMDQTFDDFMTVDEILRQRNRLGLWNGPIFVTTV